MDGSTTRDSKVSASIGVSRLNQNCWVAALAAGWLWTWHHLALEWRFNEQYQYGFAIPFLSVYLGWRRWSLFAGAEGLRPAASNGIVRLVLAGCWFLFVLAEVLRQHDPGWRLCGSAMMAAMSAATLVWVYLSGGSVLVRQMLFPVGFGWLALPWPSDAEHFLVGELTRHLTAAVIFVLNFSSIPAVQHGSVIAMARGHVGIDDACSGVQSFQSSLMAGLFLGEWFSLAFGRRAGLILGGWLIALIGNLGRVLALTLLVSRRGEAAASRWHDSFGYVSTCFIFATIFLMAWAQRVRDAEPSPSSFASRVPAWSGAMAGREGMILLAGAALVPLLAFLWFHELVAAQVMAPQIEPRWVIVTNTVGNTWKATAVPITAVEKRLLRYSKGEAWTFRNPEGWDAQMFHFFWKPGEGYPSMTYVHTPNICMPSAGWNLDGSPEPAEIRVHGVTIRGGLYRFSQGTLREIVFQTISYGGQTMSTMEDLYASGTRAERFSMLWRKPRQQINEEMMVFIPASDAGGLDLRLIGKLLESILDPARLKSSEFDASR